MLEAQMGLHQNFHAPGGAEQLGQQVFNELSRAVRPSGHIVPLATHAKPGGAGARPVTHTRAREEMSAWLQSKEGQEWATQKEELWKAVISCGREPGVGE